MLRRLAAVLVAFAFFLLCMWLSMQIKPAKARDLDGRYSNSPHKQWFDRQTNGQGMSCCHEGDAHRYDGNYTLNDDGSVTVSLDGKPHKLPAYMLLKGANPTGSAIWWFREYGNGSRTDFCFAPGTLS